LRDGHLLGGGWGKAQALLEIEKERKSAMQRRTSARDIKDVLCETVRLVNMAKDDSMQRL
jgi:hypothetical protein